MSVIITIDTLKNLQEGKKVLYTKGERETLVVVIAVVDLVLSRHVKLRVESVAEKGSDAVPCGVGDTFISGLGSHETLEVLDD